MQQNDLSEEHLALVNKMVNKKTRVERINKKLSCCSKTLIAISLFGVAGSIFPFFAGMPDLEHMPPADFRPDEAPRRQDEGPSFWDSVMGPPPPPPVENPNAEREAQRQAEDRFDFEDDQYEAYSDDRWDNEESFAKRPSLEQGRDDPNQFN